MGASLWNRLTGYDGYRFNVAHPEQVPQLLMRYNLSVWKIRKEGEELSFFASVFLRKKLSALFREENIGFRRQLWGLPRWMLLYRRRFGAALGALFAVVFLSFASTHVWEIRLAEGEMDPELLEKLSLAGLQEGMENREFDNGSFAARFLAQNPEYSYVSAGFHGGVAIVWLNERSIPPDTQQPTGAANLIAAVEGEILHCEAARGQVMVTHGDKVQKGQLLISGIVEGRTGGYRVEAAQGKVFALTQRQFETRIPLQTVRKHYTGREKRQTALKILGKKLNFFKIDGKNFEFYDTIDTVEDSTLPGGIPLPFSVEKTTLLEYETETVLLSSEEAGRMAYDQLHHYIHEELQAYQVVDQTVSVFEEEGELVLQAQLCLVEDIALEKSFDMKELLTAPQ